MCGYIGTAGAELRASAARSAREVIGPLTMTIPLEMPPHPRTAEGAPRRVGVEIEFTGLEPALAARLVRDLYGGRIEELDKHRFAVPETAFGRFEVELDASYAHPKHRPADSDRALASAIKDKVATIQGRLATTVGDVVSLWLPYEVVAPPIEIEHLPALDRLIRILRDHRARGTGGSLIYGFGLQLNPDVVSSEADNLRRHLQAYLLLSPWLRAEIDVDPTRRLLPFADRFPAAYVATALSPDYRPDLPSLIDDYLEHNPTRNRELDLLPLFAHIDPQKVVRVVADPHIKGRPTFHYRLPNSRVDEPDWGGVVEEWNRWVKVERLAAEQSRLESAIEAYRTHLTGGTEGDWVERSRQWVID